MVQTFAPVSFVARRECVVATGGFDEQFEVCEDYDFYLRFLTHLISVFCLRSFVLFISAKVAMARPEIGAIHLPHTSIASRTALS